MNASTFESRLRDRAAVAGLAVDASLLAPLQVFYELLAKWNVRINLTALPLEGLPAPTVDRLFIEPLAAAPLLLALPATAWFDIGSGSGSPAIPLALARRDLSLTMVESRARKGSFLREVARQLDVSAQIVVSRFADTVGAHADTAGLVTLRGVRLDEDLARDIRIVSRDGAIAAIFGSDSTRVSAVGLNWQSTHQLTASAFLHVIDVSRGTMH